MKFLILISLFYFVHSAYSSNSVNYVEKSFNIKDSLVIRKSTQKFINVTKILVSPKVIKFGDFNRIEIVYKKDIWEETILADKKIVRDREKEIKKYHLKPDLRMEYDEKKSEALYKTLKQTGFADTINLIFKDRLNTVFIEGRVNKIHRYIAYVKNSWGKYYFIDKLFMSWYLKNSYGEILDSFDTESLTDNYVYSLGSSYLFSEEYKAESFEKLIKAQEVAVVSGYLQLHKNPEFISHMQKKKMEVIDSLKIIDYYKMIDSELLIRKPDAIVTSKEDAALASVIVKTEAGHGSGFLISNDGYIITNYHVLSEGNDKHDGIERDSKEVTSVKIIRSNGQELIGKVVRVNKYRDLALIEVERNFEKAFSCPDTKLYKRYLNVYAIGAPKSIELEQTVSSGIISNERTINYNPLLQLNISENSGSSGGPLYDATGTLYGVVVSELFSENMEGVGFAIPSYLIQEYLNIKFN